MCNPTLRLFFYRVNFILASSFFAAPLYALSLNDYVVDSITSHPTVREQVYIFREVERDLDIARSGWRPSVDLQASTGTYDTTSPATGQQQREYESNRAELSVTQNLFNGFDTEYQMKQARARISASLYEIFDTADNIALEAIQAYVDMLKQQKLVVLADKNVSSHERILSQIRERNNSGVGRRSELEQTEGRVARAHASLIAQQNNFQDAATRLHEILGRYVQLANISEPALPEHPGSTLNGLIDIALKNHPAIKVANFNVQAALSDSSRAKSSNYPKLDLRLAKEMGNDISGFSGDTDQLSLVLNLSLNLYRGGADRANERKKISVVHQSQEFAARVQRQVINTLRLSWTADQSLSRQLKYLNRYIKNSEQTVESYGEEFFIGQRDLIDLLDAESELNSARNQKVDAYFELMSSRFRILEAIGKLFPALSLEVTVGKDDLQIADLRAQGEDTLPLDLDRDKDKKTDKVDHCDNTLLKDSINVFGCHGQQTANFGYNQLNLAPVAGDDVMELEMNSVLVIPQSVLMENDTDEDEDALRLVDFSQPENGNLAFDSKKNLIYRANDGFIGKDSFTYSITDGQGAVATATVKLKIVLKTKILFSDAQYVNFEYKQTTLTKKSKAKLSSIMAALRRIPYTAVEVFAYTDDIGPESYNVKLSERRAASVKELLIALGVDKNKIKTFGMGEKNPIADNATPEGQAINRRGELRVRFKSSAKNKTKELLERKIN